MWCALPPSTLVRHPCHPPSSNMMAIAARSRNGCPSNSRSPRVRAVPGPDLGQRAPLETLSANFFGSLSLHCHSFILHTTMKKSVTALFIAFADMCRTQRENSDYTKNLVFCIMQEISNLDVRPYTPLNWSTCEHLTHQNCKLGRAWSNLLLSVSDQQTCHFKFHVRRQLTEKV